MHKQTQPLPLYNPTQHSYFHFQFLSDATSLLFQLLLDVSTCDTKMKVLNTLSLLLERMGSAIQPHITSLLRYLPQLWVESADQKSSMLRCVILSTLNNIMKGLGPLSANLHSFVLPVIQVATNVKEVSDIMVCDIYHIGTRILQ